MSVNKVILLGNVGKDPDVRYMDSGVCVATFSLATTERGYTTQDGKQIPDRTEWHNIVVWRGLAQTVEKYVKKGDKLYIEGKIKSRNYEDQQGITRNRVEIFVDSLEMLTPKGDKVPLPADPGQPAAPQQQPAQQAAPQQPKQQAQPVQQQVDFSAEPGEDLPF